MSSTRCCTPNQVSGELTISSLVLKEEEFDVVYLQLTYHAAYGEVLQ